MKDIEKLLQYIVYLANCNESMVRESIVDIANNYGYTIDMVDFELQLNKEVLR